MKMKMIGDENENENEPERQELGGMKQNEDT